MNPTLILFALLLLLNGDLAKKKGKDHAKQAVKAEKAHSFLTYKDCMKMMNCGSSIKKECSEECRKGNTKEEVEEHVEKLRNIHKYKKDAKDVKRMSQRLDTDFSSDSESDSGEQEGYCKVGKKCAISSVSPKSANRFLSYRECVKRMNCGKALKKECKEECMEGNTEEEVEEHGSFLRKIDKYIAEAKRLKGSLQPKDNTASTTASDSDDSTDSDEDTDSDDDENDSTDDTDSDTDSDNEKEKA